MFQIDIAKVDRDFAYVAMVVHVCCKGLLPMFHLYFLNARCKCVYLDVAYVSHIRCMRVYLDVPYGCNGFQVFSGVFSSVSQACFKCFIYIHTYIATIVFGHLPS